SVASPPRPPRSCSAAAWARWSTWPPATCATCPAEPGAVPRGPRDFRAGPACARASGGGGCGMLGAAAVCEVHERMLPRRGGCSNVALIHPRSLELWHEWQRSRFRARSAAVGERLRSLRPGGASGQPPQYLLHSRKGEGEDRLLIAIDSDSAAARAALMTALPYLHAGVDVLAPADLDLPELAGSAWQRSR